jgi:hypothetical protein
MCGYNRDCMTSVTGKDIIAQFGKAMEKHSGQPYIKIYTSGSFLDPGEIAPEARDFILETAGAKARKVLVESRPEFVSRETVKGAMEKVKALEIAIGLETADDGIRARNINKGFKFEDFKRACDTAHELGATIRTYLLLKPPFMSESASIRDALESIRIAGPMSDAISINPMNVQRGTLVEGMWKKSLYRPPWLWSLLEVLKEGTKLTDARLVSAPSGGGSRRGTHNCGKCDDAILKAIESFSLGGDTTALDVPGCGCRERWLEYLDVEPFIGSAGDLDKLTLPQ